VPPSLHHRNSAQAGHVGRQVGRPLWQTGLCLFARGGHLSLSGWGALAVAPILDHGLSKLCAQIAMHNRPERRITRWEHEHLLEAVQQRLDANLEAIARVARQSSIPSER
jgi:hypothetical protein